MQLSSLKFRAYRGTFFSLAVYVFILIQQLQVCLPWYTSSLEPSFHDNKTGVSRVFLMAVSERRGQHKFCPHFQEDHHGWWFLHPYFWKQGFSNKPMGITFFKQLMGRHKLLLGEQTPFLLGISFFTFLQVCGWDVAILAIFWCKEG